MISSGRAVGGGSLIGNLIYSRGNANDFERLKPELDLSYEEALHYFKKAEMVQDKTLASSG